MDMQILLLPYESVHQSLKTKPYLKNHNNYLLQILICHPGRQTTEGQKNS